MKFKIYFLSFVVLFSTSCSLQQANNSQRKEQPEQNEQSVTFEQNQLLGKMVTEYREKNKCDDILSRIIKIPLGLEFVECKMQKGQTFISAEYKVTGQEAAKIEEFLQDNYDLGELTFVCCGWEPKDGKTGQIRIAESRFLTITMYSDETSQIDPKKWDEIPFFHVKVEVTDV